MEASNSEALEDGDYVSVLCAVQRGGEKGTEY